VYRTGDLGRVNPDGTVSVVGRIDSQVKIRGQRVELGEIEHQFKQVFHAAKNAIAWVASGAAATHALAMFYTPLQTGKLAPSTTKEVSKIHLTDPDLINGLRDAQKKLEGILPNYMIPSLYIPVTAIPLTANGKTDRQILSQMIDNLSDQDIRDFSLLSTQDVTRRDPSSQCELDLRNIIAKHLQLPAESIGVEDDFFRLGGNSLLAIKICAAARQNSLPLTVQVILESPTIERMAHALDSVVSGAANALKPRQPFDLLQGSYNEDMARGEFAIQCRVDERSITDAFPCTPIQEIMFLESLKASGSYVVKYEWIIPHSIDIERFRRAWEHVYRANEIIRTRLVENSEGRLVQVVVDDKLYWHHETGAVVTEQPIMGLGQQLYRFSLLQAPVQSSEWRFVLEAHHSVIDGWTLNLLLQALTEAYNDVMRPPEYRYRDFVEYTGAMSREAQSEFWAQLLYDEVPSTLPSQREGSRAQVEAQGRIHNRSTAFTVSDFVKAAWAVVLSELYSHSNIILGVVESGRDSALPGIELIAEPTLATVPFPVQVRERDSIDTLLQGIHRVRASMIPYLHCGMREISATTKNAEKACQLRNLIVVQPVRGDEKDDGLLLLDPVVKISLQDCDLILECQLHKDSVSFNLDYNTAYISSSDAQALLRRLASLFETLQTSNSSALLQTLAQHDSADRATIQRWNANLPVEVKECVHHLITSQALRTPDAMATEGWDGCLTYQQLDESANQLACRLVDQGITPGQRVPVISEKSIFYVVTLLAILKTGACFVPLEPSQPAQRLHEIFKILSATHCLVTPETKKAIAVPGCKLIEPSVLMNLDAACDTSEPAFSAPGGQSAKLAYVIFTSGSTGKPKGVMVSHAALNAGALARAQSIQRTKRSRVFAFSSHSFDTSIEDVLTTLVVGGCICVPSSYERDNNLAGAIEKYRANTLDTTPSVAATIDPRTVPGLETLILGGEAVTTDNVQTWSSHVKIFNTYGPSECAIVSTVSEILKDSIAVNIGRGAGCITWIVDENNHDRLMPVGDVGELLIEGPIVGDGYVGNESQTKQSFIPTTTWRSTFNYGQNWPMYKTGDLVKYAADGTLLFLGRKDSQIKLRGQRIELGEIEHALREATADYKIRVAVDFTKISDEQPVIVGYLCDLPYMKSSLPSLLRAGSSHNAIMLMESHLAATLPSYMLPSYYVVLHDLPMTTSGKLDRKTLRELFLSEYKGLQIASERRVVSVEQPRHHVGLALQSLWGRVLGISPSQIGCPDNFFALGGNSLSAMQLVNSCVTLGLKLSLTDVFKSSSLQSMSDSVIAKMGVSETSGDRHVESSCSLVGRVQAETILMKASETHDLQSSNVQDMYPASALQDSFIRGSLQTPGAYIATHVFSIDRSISRHQVEQAWAAVVQQCDILRMRLFHVEQYGTIQVVMHHQTTVLSEAPSVQDEMDAAKNMKIDFGTPLWKASLVEDSALRFVWTAHHSVYDGWTLDCLASALSAQCREVDYRYKPYRDFIQYISDIDKPMAEKYWRKSLENTTQIGRLTNNTSTIDSSRQVIASTIDFCPGQQSRLQSSTYILAAWALTLSQYTESLDIVFGNTSTGRTGSLSDLQQIIGPTMTVSPMRVVIDQSVTVSDYLRAIQDQRAEMLQFEQLGIQRIRELSDDCSRACDFETLLDIHTHMVTKHSQDAFKLQTSQAVNKTFHTHALVLTCTMSRGSVHIDFDYNQSSISQVLAHRLVSHFQHMLLQLLECADGRPESTLADLEIITPAEAAQIIAWNASPHKIVDQCIHDVVLAKVKEAPQAQAVYGWDASFTYEELAHLSSRLAFHLLSLNLGSKPIIPLCFSKSAWTVVAMLAVLRVGGSYVALDTSHPTERLRSIVQKTRSNIVLVAPEFKNIFENQVSSVFVLDRNISEQLHDSGILDARTHSSPSDAAMICFTSGSTGNPKGVVLQHDAFCTLAESVQEELQLSANSRVLQFAAYAFDVSNAEIFLTLMKGGCCCIPSEYDRLNDLSGVITRMEINWLYLTPTAATFVTAKDISSIRTLVLGGEAARQELIDRFASCTRLINSYGPAEGTIWPSLARLSSDSLPADIGCGSGCNMWLVDASNHQRLVPLGTTGEIVLEGPLVARGYLFDEVATRAAFIERPSWAAQANNESQRFYKVGDLARQNRDGTLSFVGRKDSQRKLRGQRIELGEIEYRISSSGRAFNAAAVEVVTTVENVQALVAFICPDTSIKAEYRNNIATMTPYLMEELQKLRTTLAQTLPSYMVPTFFVPMEILPTSLSRKLDRKSLRLLMEKLTAQELLSFTLSRTQHKKAPISEKEFEMRSLWSQVLNLNVEDVGMDDNPTSLGVNSFLAIKLSGQARKRGMVMSVADILRTNSLRALASSVQRTTIESRTVQPFGLLYLATETDILQIRKDVDSFCGADAGQLLDAYPCTAMQEGMLMLSQKEEGAYVAQRVFSVAPGAERDDLQRAWNVVAQRCDILRTRLIPSSRYGTLQVVIEDRIDWKQAPELHDYLLKDKHQVFDYGQPMMRYCLVHDQENKITHFVWTTHHAVYDGWTINRVLALVNQSYYGKELTPQPPFRRFIESIHTKHVEESSRKFWSDYLDGYCSSASILSQSSQITSTDHARSTTTTHVIKLCDQSACPVTMPTVIQTAWALLLGRHNNYAETSFGLVLNGRNVPVSDILEICGPTMTTIPVRVRVDPKSSIHDLLHDTQEQRLLSMPYEHLGLRSIQKLSPAAQMACSFESLLVIDTIS
jgi:amino acid adenylation domain-containing protein